MGCSAYFTLGKLCLLDFQLLQLKQLKGIEGRDCKSGEDKELCKASLIKGKNAEITLDGTECVCKIFTIFWMLPKCLYQTDYR